MNKLKVLDLFSGIGGFSLGLERTGGFETVAFCEIEEFPRKVLAKHWPEVPCYHDIRTLTKDILDRDGIAVDAICGGFPCQDISTAGKQKGMANGTRSGLWSEIIRLVSELRPRFIIVENVANLLSGPSDKPGGWFGRVLGDLAGCGYDAEWENIPASAMGAPHRRERVWLVAYHDENAVATGNDEWPECFTENRSEIWPIFGSGCSPLANAYKGYVQRQQSNILNPKKWKIPILGQVRPYLAGIGRQWEIEPDVGRVADGVPSRSHRLAALGNAVVPQIPELIGRAILASMAKSE
jgi:DNA (cytosine-5)-methyltransferase 1